MKERLSQLLKEPVSEVKKIFGDASYRTYYRGFLENGKTVVLMVMPEGKMSVSEEVTSSPVSGLKARSAGKTGGEVTNAKNKPAELPYINIQRYLKTIGMPVPEIILFSEANRWLVLEDLGDTKLFDAVSGADTATLVKWYKKAIDLRVEMQNKTNPSPRPSPPRGEGVCIAFQRSFDVTLFDWEFDHFLEYYFQRSAVSDQPSTKDKELFKTETQKITQQLCQLPKGFTHRDYQSRNLMVVGGDKLCLLDFQDALLGPRCYDVVALLRDSYVDVTAHLEELLGYYCEHAKTDLKKFRREFDLQTVQRKLKDAGRFVFINRVKKNPNFLPFIPASMGYVRQALERLPEHKELYGMLKKYVTEWGNPKF